MHGLKTETRHEGSSAVVHEVHKYLISPKTTLGKITNRRPWYDYLIEPIIVHKTDLHIYIYKYIAYVYKIKERKTMSFSDKLCLLDPSFTPGSCP